MTRTCVHQLEKVSALPASPKPPRPAATQPDFLPFLGPPASLFSNTHVQTLSPGHPLAAGAGRQAEPSFLRTLQTCAVQGLRRQLLTWRFRRGSACASVRVAGEEGSLTTRKFEYHSSMECDLMETDILESLEDLGYKGPLLEDGALSQAVTAGASSPEFTKLCAWLVSELRVLCKLEENVQATNSPSEAEEFQLEVSGLLGEMNCPYLSLTSGDVTKRLLIQKNCLLLLTYLISELEAARMLCVNTLPKKAQEGGGSEVFQELKGICIALGMSKPPANITMFQFFSGIEKKLKET